MRSAGRQIAKWAVGLTSVYIDCTSCGGHGRLPPDYWSPCQECGQTGRVWAPGAPLYGCVETLADRVPGEIVTLGNGDRGKILWHLPWASNYSKKLKKLAKTGTFLGLIEEFTGNESHKPVYYPSCIGVLSVDFARALGDVSDHSGEKFEDEIDPVHKQTVGMLI